MSDVLTTKLSDMALKRKRIQKLWSRRGGAPLPSFDEEDFSRDGIVLNLQHFIEDLTDCCKHLVLIRDLGVPKDNKEVFALLHQGGLIDFETREYLSKANGLRNNLVHRYTKTEMYIVQRAVEKELGRLYAAAQKLVREEYDRSLEKDSQREQKPKAPWTPGSNMDFSP